MKLGPHQRELIDAVYQRAMNDAVKGHGYPPTWVIRQPRQPGVEPMHTIYQFKNLEIANKYREWEAAMPRPRLYEYIIRWWLTVALPYRDWKLPWR